ncbi:MAG: hypothetical protein IGR76_11450 [Synechococcales cyanobacterium T60_A2020_003]|nr:hypothetical protein [Synechococcales cyanobacterium T60_A2020_003]
MAVETIGNPTPEAEQLRVTLETQLPNIIASFNQVLREQYGLSGISVARFTVIPDVETPATVSSDQDSCSIS